MSSTFSIDLAVRGRDSLSVGDQAPRPPVEAYLRVIDEPVLRLVSVDLGARPRLRAWPKYLTLPATIWACSKPPSSRRASFPPGMEGSGERLVDLLARLVGPGHGLEVVSQVNGIPKGSRLAVSTTLLASLIAVCMRATGQTAALTGTLQEHERRVVAARAILGEWLGGSGGGWQDSGGVWPGMKLITGVLAEARRSRVRHQPGTVVAGASDAGTGRGHERDATAVAG